MQSNNNSSGIKLLIHAMKLWERIIDLLLRDIVSRSDNTVGFDLGLESLMLYFHQDHTREVQRQREQYVTRRGVRRSGKGIRHRTSRCDVEMHTRDRNLPEAYITRSVPRRPMCE